MEEALSTKWHSSAPLRYCNLDRVNLPVDMGQGVLLRNLPDWIKNESIIDVLSYHHRQHLTKKIQVELSVDYESNALGDPDPEWEGEKQRSKQSVIEEKFQFIALSLWIVQPSNFGYELIIHAETLLSFCC